MSTGDENRDREPLHFIHKYISHRLEPEPITDSPLKLTPMESIAFLRSLKTTGVLRLNEDGSYTKTHDARWRSRIVIRQLYGEIHEINRNLGRLIDDGVDPGDVIKYHSSRVNRSITEDECDKIRSISDLSKFHDYTDTLFALEQSERILPFLALSQVLIEAYSIDIIEDNLISDRYSGSNNTTEFLKGLSQPIREQLIQRTEILNAHVVSDMMQVRKARNEVVHELHSAEFIGYINNSLSDINRCIDVIIEMESAIDVVDAFGWEWRSD
jgi:hypothetical protein